MNDKEYGEKAQELGATLGKGLEALHQKGASEAEIDAYWALYWDAMRALRDERMKGWSEERRRNYLQGWNSAGGHFKRAVDDLAEAVR